MKRFTTAREAHRYLEELPMFATSGQKAARFGLERMEEMCKVMGHPERNLRVIHVAGTNGKGTVCRFLFSAYCRAGYPAGIYTSPHLVRFNERIQTAGKIGLKAGSEGKRSSDLAGRSKRDDTELALEIPDEALLEFFQSFGRQIEEIEPTYFEISTSLAFWYLDRTGADPAIIETGLGGRLDATNLVDPLVSVITSISYDHTDILGESLEDIAREKAGIIKSGRPVVVGGLPVEALAVVRRSAADFGSELIEADGFQTVSPPPADTQIQNKQSWFVKHDPASGEDIRVSAEGWKQIDKMNLAITWSVIEELKELYSVTPRQFVEAVEEMDRIFPLNAHFQRLHPSQEWYFDGAHNQEAIKALIEHVEQAFPGRDPVFVLSMMADKAKKEVLENFQPYQNVYYFVTGKERSAEYDQIRETLPQAMCIRNDRVAISRLLAHLKSELVIFAGSFYFYPQVKHWMASQPPSDHETDSVLRT